MLSCSQTPTQLVHARRRGLVSQVEILGLALEAWSNQWNRRVVFIRIMRKQKQVLQSHRSKWCYEIHYSHGPVCNPTLPTTRLQYFHKPKDSDQTPSPWVSGWGTSGHFTNEALATYQGKCACLKKKLSRDHYQKNRRVGRKFGMHDCLRNNDYGFVTSKCGSPV